MESDLFDLLRTHKIFTTLNESELQHLMTKLTRIELPPDYFLFHQSETAQYVYILMKGKLTALHNNGKNQLHTVGIIHEGELIGELGALANSVYPYSVKARRHCVLYQLSSKDFQDFCMRFPAVMLAAIHPIISVTQNSLHLLSSEETHHGIAMIPANKHVDINPFVEKFTSIIEHIPSIILISDFSSEYNYSGISTAFLNEKLQNIEHNKKSTQKIIYLLKSSHTLLAKIVLQKADLLYLIAEANLPPELDPYIDEIIKQDNHSFKTLPYLILLHSPNTLQPRHTALWLQHLPVNQHHHLRINSTKHFNRLIRFLRGKATGLVLSGGGTRGWAHLGAIKAICDQNLSIDFIGGTSVGAIVGGCFGLTETYEPTFEYFNQIIAESRHSISARSFTLPIVSIFDAKTFTNILTRVFDNSLIEDLWLPYFCISSNLANYSEEIHRTGLLWEKTRASSSIPGLIPPTVINGEIHFDGGLLNNLPVDVMWNYVGKQGKTIAIELTSSMHDYHKYHFPPVLTLKQSLLSKLGMNYEIYKFPRFIDSFFRGLLVGSSAKARYNAHTATILVNLSLRKFRILQFNQQHAQKMLEIGYVETTNQILQYRNRKLLHY